MIRLLLIDDHRLILEGLQKMFAAKEGFEVVGTADDGERGVSTALSCRPDVIILDMTMPGMSGIETARALRVQLPDAKILALSMHNDLRYIGELLRIGAKGYILKDCSTEELVHAVTTVAEGNIALSSEVLKLLVSDYLRLQQVIHNSNAMVGPAITERERSVLTLMTEGLNSKAIGERLSISKNTVDTHRRRMMDKLGCNSVADLIRYALREGLVEL